MDPCLGMSINYTYGPGDAGGGVMVREEARKIDPAARTLEHLKPRWPVVTQNSQSRLSYRKVGDRDQSIPSVA